MFRILTRVKACPLPGFTNWNSTTAYGWPSTIILRPFRMSLVSIGLVPGSLGAGPLPQRWPRRTSMDDASDELREIKREIVESRGLIIKTNNLTNALAADLKSISKRQLGFERSVLYNGAAAYFVFVVVVIGVVYVAWDARIATATADLRRAQEKRSEE